MNSSLTAMENSLMNAIPDDLERHFTHMKDPNPGDRERYHLYCYYNDGTAIPPPPFHYEWSLSGTQLATSQAPEALRQRERENATESLKHQIRSRLEAEVKRLVVQSDGKLLMESAA
jgi:hypothetical protein